MLAPAAHLGAMEPREPRNKVLVKARMQCGSQWQDVCILNYSAHGLGLTCDTAPPRGSYLEIRRGPYVMVARVAWSKGHRFGARTQDPIPHVAIIGKVAPEQRCHGVERRVASRTLPRPARMADRALSQGRSIEFAGMALAIAAAAGVLAESAYAELSAPLDKVRAALSVSAP